MALSSKETKLCPICGSSPKFEIQDLGKPNGRGYPGRFAFWLSCSHCDLPKHVSSDTVYHDSEKAHSLVINSWNKEVKRIQKFLDKNNAFKN